MIKKLLCVDDDKTTLTLIKLIVNKVSFAEEIITKQNGKEALEYYHELSESAVTDDYPDLVFLDLNMPIMNGWDFLDEFVAQFYKKFAGTKIIILSSSTDPEEKERAKKYPFIIDYVSKPLTVSALKNLLIV
ncbi:response regulator [Emticicia sp. 17c]|uniref:response regulator n=1 Tax=Emticicia sp. 17c TaxID=3127704 RepID=UPI00301B8FF8